MWWIVGPPPIIDSLYTLTGSLRVRTRYSAILFGSILRDIRAQERAGTDGEEEVQSGSSKPQPKLYSLEIDPLVASIAMNLISLAGLADIVEVVVGASARTLQRLHDEGTLAPGGIDLLFLDHSEELYEADVKLCRWLLPYRRAQACVVRRPCHQRIFMLRGHPDRLQRWQVHHARSASRPAEAD